MCVWLQKEWVCELSSVLVGDGSSFTVVDAVPIIPSSSSSSSTVSSTSSSSSGVMFAVLCYSRVSGEYVLRGVTKATQPSTVTVTTTPSSTHAFTPCPSFTTELHNPFDVKFPSPLSLSNQRQVSLQCGRGVAGVCWYMPPTTATTLSKQHGQELATATTTAVTALVFASSSEVSWGLISLPDVHNRTPTDFTAFTEVIGFGVTDVGDDRPFVSVMGSTCYSKLAVKPDGVVPSGLSRTIPLSSSTSQQDPFVSGVFGGGSSVKPMFGAQQQQQLPSSGASGTEEKEGVPLDRSTAGALSLSHLGATRSVPKRALSDTQAPELFPFGTIIVPHTGVKVCVAALLLCVTV